MNRYVATTISKRYGERTAVDDLSIALGLGVTGLLGPNGAGKSTLIRILATVATPTSGSLALDGRDALREPNVVRAVLGYLPQEFEGYPQLTAREFLAYVAALKNLRRSDARAQIGELLVRLNLASAGDRPMGTLSGGMRQRVGIAQALLGTPRILIVDEPTVGLDPEERVRFRQMLRELAQTSIVLVSTHIVSDLESVADRIVILDRGNIVRDGTPGEVVGSTASLEAAYLAAVGSGRRA